MEDHILQQQAEEFEFAEEAAEDMIQIVHTYLN
jgi:hypothetical protein